MRGRLLASIIAFVLLAAGAAGPAAGSPAREAERRDPTAGPSTVDRLLARMSLR